MKIKMLKLNYLFCMIHLFHEGGGSTPSELWTFIVVARYFTSNYDSSKRMLLFTVCVCLDAHINTYVKIFCLLVC